MKVDSLFVKGHSKGRSKGHLEKIEFHLLASLKVCTTFPLTPLIHNGTNVYFELSLFIKGHEIFSRNALKYFIAGKKIYEVQILRQPKISSLLVIVLSCPPIGSLSSSTTNQRAAQNNYRALGCQELYFLNSVTCNCQTPVNLSLRCTRQCFCELPNAMPYSQNKHRWTTFVNDIYQHFVHEFNLNHKYASM